MPRPFAAPRPVPCSEALRTCIQRPCRAPPATMPSPLQPRYGASTRTPADPAPFLAASWPLPGPFLAKTRVNLSHANHALSVPRRPATCTPRRGCTRPFSSIRATCRAMVSRLPGRTIPFRIGSIPMTPARDGAGAVRWCERAHPCHQPDRDFFATYLPSKRHRVTLPTPRPASEAELVRRRGMPASNASPHRGETAVGDRQAGAHDRTGAPAREVRTTGGRPARIAGATSRRSGDSQRDRRRATPSSDRSMRAHRRGWTWRSRQSPSPSSRGPRPARSPSRPAAHPDRRARSHR